MHVLFLYKIDKKPTAVNHLSFFSISTFQNSIKWNSEEKLKPIPVFWLVHHVISCFNFLFRRLECSENKVDFEYCVMFRRKVERKSCTISLNAWDFLLSIFIDWPNKCILLFSYWSHLYFKVFMSLLKYFNIKIWNHSSSTTYFITHE